MICTLPVAIASEMAMARLKSLVKTQPWEEVGWGGAGRGGWVGGEEGCSRVCVCVCVCGGGGGGGGTRGDKQREGGGSGGPGEGQ